MAFFDGKGQFGVALARKLDQGAAFPPRRHDQRCDVAVLGQDPIEPVVRVVTVVGLALPRYFQRSTTAAGLLLLLLLLESLLQVHLPYALLLLGQVLRSLLPKLVPLGLDVDAL